MAMEMYADAIGSVTIRHRLHGGQQTVQSRVPASTPVQVLARIAAD